MSQNETDSNVVKVPLEEIEYCWKRTPGGEIQRVFTCDLERKGRLEKRN